MPEKDNKILKYNNGEKSVKTPFISYADLESLVGKVNVSHNNPEKSSATKINKHTPSCYSLFTHYSFDTTKSKLDYYRDKNCILKMIPLTKEEKEFHNMQKVCDIDQKVFSTVYNNKKYHKVKDHCHYTGEYRGASHDICNLKI